jgi:hypothetical protein
MSKLCYFGQIALLAYMVVSVSCKVLYQDEDSQQQDSDIIQGDPAIVQAVGKANLIVVGRVIGLIDPKPAARDRKHLEAHWIFVVETLKGVDETGQQLAARPNGLLWEDGKSYIIFLQRTGMGNFAEAVTQQLVEANDANIAVIRDEILAQGGSVISQPILWMQYVSGFGTVIAELLVTVEGNFEWKKQLQIGGDAEPEYERLIGNLPEEAIADLITQIGPIEPGLIADDSGIITFRWSDEEGKTQSSSCYTLDNPSCVELLQTVETLAREHGQEPEVQD